MASQPGARAQALDYISRQSAPTLGAGEAAQLLGITRSHLNHLATDDRTFPRPFTILAGSRYWWRSGIEFWAALHRPTRREAHGHFGPEAAEILRLAERASAELRHAGVGEIHLWLALVDVRSPGIVRHVLASLGVDGEEVRTAVLRALPAGDDDSYAPALAMSPHVQSVVGRAAANKTELRTATANASAIALALLDDDPPTGTGGRHRDPVISWLERRGLDFPELRSRIVRATVDPAAIAGFDLRVLPKRRPARTRRRPAELRDLAPNPLGHDPWDRHPWGSTFARLATGKSWTVEGRQYFFFYDRDRYRIRTADGHPVGYWWQIEPRPKPGRQPRGSKGAVVLPLPADDIEWPERLSAFNREHLLARRPHR